MQLVAGFTLFLQARTGNFGQEHGNSAIQADKERQKYVVMPFAKSAKATPTYFRALSGALGGHMRTLLDDVEENYQRWLVEKCALQDGRLVIDLIRGITSDVKQNLDLGGGAVIRDVHAIEPRGEQIRVQFDDVIFFQAYDECAHKDVDQEYRDLGIVGRYAKSSLMNYIEKETRIMDIVPGTLMHFEVMTGDDWFHVITREEPKIVALNRA